MGVVLGSWVHVHVLLNQSNDLCYCGWKKSCATLDGSNPRKNGMFTIFQLEIRISQPSTAMMVWLVHASTSYQWLKMVINDYRWLVIMMIMMMMMMIAVSKWRIPIMDGL